MLEWLMALVRQTLESEVATGMTAGALLLGAISFVVYQLRSIPARIIGLIETQFTLTLTVQHDDEVYHALSVWLAKHKDARKTRRFSVVTEWEEHDGGGNVHAGFESPRSIHDPEPKRVHKLTPGEGIHLIRHKGRFFLLGKEIHQPGQDGGNGGRGGPPGGGSFRRTESITIRTYGRNGDVLRQLLADVTAPEKKDETVAIHFWARGYRRVHGRLKRSLDTVFLDEGVKQRLLTDIEQFLSRRRWYADRGIPWRRGYLLEGPPGTGKSTIIFALASLLGKPIYIINPSSIYGDEELMHAMNDASGGIVVIEDADSFKVTQSRQRSREGGEYGIETTAQGMYGGRQQEEAWITLSGLLNAIDGIASAEGRILFITSNHPDTLDPALLRAGRIDRRERLGLADERVAREMFAAFFPSGDADAFVSTLTLPMAPAAIQNLLVERLEATNTPNPVTSLQEKIEERMRA